MRSHSPTLQAPHAPRRPWQLSQATGQAPPPLRPQTSRQVRPGVRAARDWRSRLTLWESGPEEQGLGQSCLPPPWVLPRTEPHDGRRLSLAFRTMLDSKGDPPLALHPQGAGRDVHHLPSREAETGCQGLVGPQPRAGKREGGSGSVCRESLGLRASLRILACWEHS